MFGRNAITYNHSKNRFVGRDVDVHKRLKFISFDTN